MKMSTLKKKAQQCTKARGHHMRWKVVSDLTLMAQCSRCGRWVRIGLVTLSDPAKSVGSALAINCKE